jgi:hypothetical protein
MLVMMLIQVAVELARWCRLAFRSTQSVQAENLFLRRQLALYIERGVKPRRVDSASRLALAFLSRFFRWRDALVVVRPETMIRWHRAGWKLFWLSDVEPYRSILVLTDVEFPNVGERWFSVAGSGGFHSFFGLIVVESRNQPPTMLFGRSFS